MILQISKKISLDVWGHTGADHLTFFASPDGQMFAAMFAGLQLADNFTIVANAT